MDNFCQRGFHYFVWGVCEVCGTPSQGDAIKDYVNAKAQRESLERELEITREMLRIALRNANAATVAQLQRYLENERRSKQNGNG